MSTIRDTITEAMKDHGMGQYVSQADPIIRQVEQREYGIADDLVSYAASHGLPSGEARVALEARGLMFRPGAQHLAPVNEPDLDLTEIRAALVRMQEQIDRLSERG